MADYGISTLGVLFGYGVEATAGTKPASFTKLTRISSIGSISVDPETLDASALEDTTTKSIAGRADTGGTFTVTVNATDATLTEWTTLITAYQALEGGKQMWFETYSPSLNKAVFVVAQPPTQLPAPSFDQNSVLTMDINLTIVDYKGYDTAIVPA